MEKRGEKEKKKKGRQKENFNFNVGLQDADILPFLASHGIDFCREKQ